MDHELQSPWGRRPCSAARAFSPPRSCLLATSPRDVDARDLYVSTSWAPARPTSSSLTPATESTQWSSTVQYPLHATPLTNSSSPTPSPYPCEPSVRPGTLPAPLNRPGAVFLPQLRPKAPPSALHVARPPPCFSTTSERLDEVVLSPWCYPTLPLAFPAAVAPRFPLAPSRAPPVPLFTWPCLHRPPLAK